MFSLAGAGAGSRGGDVACSSVILYHILLERNRNVRKIRKTGEFRDEEHKSKGFSAIVVVSVYE